MDILNQDRLRLIKWPWLLALLALFGLGLALTLVHGWQAHAREWLNLVVRWLHIIYGIAWIGASFYFIFLENALERHGVRAELSGNLWAIHGGGIYYLEKYKTAPAQLPKHLHWFKWDAYLTWVTGFLLLVIVYYADPRAILLPPNSPLPSWAAVAIAVASLPAAWLVYAALSSTQLLYRPALFLLVGGALVALAAYLLGQVFSGRGVFMHIGAMLGTIMAANVFFVIIPSQKKLVRAAQKGEALDPGFVAWVQLRSRHNNYLTLPVLFTMIAHHFPFTYTHGANWLILILLFVAGVAVRHFINVTEKEHKRTLVEGGAMPYLLVGAAASVLVAFYLTAPRTPTAQVDAPVPFAEVEAMVRQHCHMCHAARPTQPGFASAPAGVMFDTPEQIVAQADKIKRTAVDTTYMPLLLPGVPPLTQEQRARLGAWVAQGARGP
ncbi:MAG: urate hydroxylase PuuD [Meiothermus sp.]|uniref:urate hydroxylase PuuD n=1 Tax=Meiothermus sp. TaxID=1955249 RepID=UPI0025E52128|nr:urate hydroxylase PuuD [Meiothermus sp.]MCS7193847.1 urate hydroxylase PuuD [Meiothermus sp.]MDW8090307.1 urate hydroxylase PuuD [Meiothermus sp.]MDW8481268.1 urate hydroxylase PuuD [Meiothermus sp.]